MLLGGICLDMEGGKREKRTTRSPIWGRTGFIIVFISACRQKPKPWLQASLGTEHGIGRLAPISRTNKERYSCHFHTNTSLSLLEFFLRTKWPVWRFCNSSVSAHRSMLAVPVQVCVAPEESSAPWLKFCSCSL